MSTRHVFSAATLNPLIFRRALPRLSLRSSTENRHIILTDALLQTVCAHQQIQQRNEAGGILLGRLWPERITVEQASEPGLGDRAGRCFFERDPRRAQEIINVAWEKSYGEVNYLGEWHTHPEPHPQPSPRDRAMIRTMFKGARSHHGSLLLLIIGTRSLWVGLQTRKGLEELHLQRKVVAE